MRCLWCDAEINLIAGRWVSGFFQYRYCRPKDSTTLHRVDHRPAMHDRAAVERWLSA